LSPDLAAPSNSARLSESPFNPTGISFSGGEAGNGNPDGYLLGSSSFGLTRYTPTGQLDTSFGSNGIVTTTLSSNLSFINVVLLQSDGKIVAVGNTGTAGESSFSASFVAARYLAQ